MTVGDDDYFLYMLFYNVHLSCYFVIELKISAVKPKYIGKLNLLRKQHDHPSIGLLLCKKHNKLVAEYFLKRTDGVISIAEYLLSHELPKELKDSLPDLGLLEAKLVAEKL